MPWRWRCVCDIMHGAEELPLCGEDLGMDEAILVMTRYRFGCVGVVDRDNRLVGVVTDGDLRRHMANDLLHRKVAEVRPPPAARGQRRRSSPGCYRVDW